MKAFVNRVLAALYFFLCFSPVPMMVGLWLLNDHLPALAAAAAMLPLSLLIALLPEHIGGKRKKQVLQARGTGDPDPDRNLRSDAMPQRTHSRRFPLRMVVLIVSALLITGVIMFAPVLGLDEIFVFYRFVMGVSLGVLMMMAQYSVSTGEACNLTSILTGIVVYLVVGFMSVHVFDSASFQTLMYYMGAGFLLVTGFLLNERALSAGAISSQAYKPPRPIVIRNRVILGVFALIVLLVAQFNNLRIFCSNAFRAVMRAFVKVIGWLNSFIDPDVTVVETTREIEAATEGEALTGGIESWSTLEIIGAAFAMAIALAFVILMLVKFFKWTKKFRERLKEWFKSFSSGVGEEYEDVRESLMDFNEVRENFGETLKERITKLLKRDPKWAELNAKERVRFLLTLIYRKNLNSFGDFSSLTAREALAEVKTGFKDPGQFADLYERARYSQHDVTLEEADAAKREARL